MNPGMDDCMQQSGELPMKIPRFIVLLLVLAVLAACAAGDPRPVDTSAQAGNSYVDTIERNARTKGIDVVWINAPKPRRAAEDESDGN